MTVGFIGVDVVVTRRLSLTQAEGRLILPLRQNIDGVQEKIRQYRDEGYLIFGISNQGVLPMDLKHHSIIMQNLMLMIALFERGNPFYLIKTCFHHEKGTVEPYKHRSLLRKPDMGMLALCEVESYETGYIVDLDNSLFVGDRPEDEMCARNAGISFQWTKDFFNRS